MKRRDQQAQQLHGRLIHKSWAEPGKSSRRWFWGRLHYRGPLSRPNYFVAVYEDSDYEIMSAATARRLLKPAGTQLPAGISIPEVSQQLLQQLASTDLQEREAAAQNLQQQLTAAAAVMPLSVAVPSSADTKLLLSSLDLSRVAFTADPISSNHQLQAQLQQHGVVHMLQQPPFPAAIIIMAMQPASAASSLQLALARQPAFLACFIAGHELPAAVQRLLQQRQLQHAVIKAGGGLWLCLSAGALDTHHYLLSA
jgi:hypothetical protein